MSTTSKFTKLIWYRIITPWFEKSNRQVPCRENLKIWRRTRSKPTSLCLNTNWKSSAGKCWLSVIWKIGGFVRCLAVMIGAEWAMCLRRLLWCGSVSRGGIWRMESVANCSIRILRSAVKRRGNYSNASRGLYVSNAGANKSFNSGTIGEVSRVVQSVSASSICSRWVIAGRNDGWRAIRQETGDYRVAARIVGLRISHGQCGLARVIATKNNRSRSS